MQLTSYTKLNSLSFCK